MKTLTATIASIVVSLFSSTCFSQAIAPISIESYSSALSATTWPPSKTLDGDPATFWITTKTDTAPYVTYRFDNGPVELGVMTLSNYPAGYRNVNTANLFYREGDTGEFTRLGSGPFQFNLGANALTGIDFGGVMARYVRIEVVSSSDGSTIFYMADHTGEAVSTWLVGYAEIAFAEAEGIANAGADFEVYDADDDAEELVTLDATASSYGDGSIVSYAWTENDVEIATGVTPQVALAVGVHTITLTVTCDDATVDSDTVVVTVVGTPQSFANAGSDITVTDSDQSGGETVTLDGSASAWSTTTWDWYEGAALLGSGATLDVALAVGVHTITLQCTDHLGHSDSDEVVVTVLDGTPHPPVADAGIDRSLMNRNGTGLQPVALDGSGSVDHDGAIVSYVWSEGGSQIATGVAPTVTLDIGVHVITLTVTDDDDQTGVDTVTINVVAYVPSPDDQPRVTAWDADNLFETITADDMAIIASKKILVASRSFGLNLNDGLNAAANIDAMYALDKATGFNVRVEGLDALPVDIFDSHNYVQFLANVNPYTQRLVETDYFLRTRGYGNAIDAVMVFYHSSNAATFPTYQAYLDSWRIDFPDLKVIYVTAGVPPVPGDGWMVDSNIFSDMVLDEYLGEVPIYDMRDILSVHADATPCTVDWNGTVYRYMCPEFNINGDNTHPNSAFSELRMGKAFLLLLKQMFCAPQRKAGDCNGDGAVDIQDFVILKQNYGSAGADWSQGDFNDDGNVDIQDFVILKQNYGL